MIQMAGVNTLLRKTFGGLSKWPLTFENMNGWNVS